MDLKTNACKHKLDKGEICGSVGDLGAASPEIARSRASAPTSRASERRAAPGSWPGHAVAGERSAGASVTGQA